MLQSVAIFVETGKTHPYYWSEESSELQVFSSTKRLPPREHGWWKVDLATLATAADFTHAPNLVINGGPATALHKVSGVELVASLEKFPRFAPSVDVDGRCPEADEELVRLAADTASRLALPKPVQPPLSAATKARTRGFELTPEECQKTVIGESWLRRLGQAEPPGLPSDFRTNGLAPAYDNEGRVVPQVDTFGKYFPEDLPGARFGWQRVTGAYVGFAIGEALGSEFDRPGRIGPLTQQLLFHTESVIRSPHREDPNAEAQFATVARNGLLRWLHTQGVPFERADGWLVQVPELHARRDPEPGELAAVMALSTGSPTPGLTGPAALVVALPAALTEGGPGSGLSGGSREAVRLLAGLTHSDDTDLEAATYLTWLFEKALTKDEFSFPVWTLGREIFSDSNAFQQGPAWSQLKAMADRSLPLFTQTGLPDLKNPGDIGDGRSTLSVLGRAFAAVAGYENNPERALLRAVSHSGRNALTGALAGALIGARTGVPGLPEKWVEQLELRYAIETSHPTRSSISTGTRHSSVTPNTGSSGTRGGDHERPVPRELARRRDRRRAGREDRVRLDRQDPGDRRTGRYHRLHPGLRRGRQDHRRHPDDAVHSRSADPGTRPAATQRHGESRAVAPDGLPTLAAHPRHPVGTRARPEGRQRRS
jgi:ADP-ribosylglycohydrolase